MKHQGLLNFYRNTGLWYGNTFQQKYNIVYHSESHTCQLFLWTWGSWPATPVIGWDNNFCIILYFSKDFEAHVACKKVLNYCNILEKSMFKDK